MKKPYFIGLEFGFVERQQVKFFVGQLELFEELTQFWPQFLLVQLVFAQVLFKV